MGLISVGSLSPEKRADLVRFLNERWNGPNKPTEDTIAVYLQEYVRCINYLRRGYPDAE